jgi:ferredoxin-NADP reductase
MLTKPGVLLRIEGGCVLALSIICYREIHAGWNLFAVLLLVPELKNRFSVAERTTAFQFEKPTNFIFRPGQWIDITLLNPAETDAEGNVRGFSIASAPYEHTLMVATRMRDTAFKRELAKVPLDTEVKIVGPGGNLTLHNNSARTAVFLAGGIGVTPIRSIVLHAAKQRLPHRIFSSSQTAGQRMRRFSPICRHCKKKIQTTHASPP